MQTNAKNNSLTKKVLFSVVAAGLLSGFVLSAEAAVWMGSDRYHFDTDATLVSEGNYAVDSSADSLVIDKCYQAGVGSKLVFGASEQAAEAKFAQTGLKWGTGDGEISSAVYIAKSVKLDGVSQLSSIFANEPNVIGHDPHYVKFEACTLLMVDAALVKEQYAITNISGMATFNGMSTDNPGDNATRLYIDGAKKGETYKLFEGDNTNLNELNEYGNHAATEFRGLNLDFISSDNSLLKFIDEPNNTDPDKFKGNEAYNNGENPRYFGEYHVIAQTQSVNEAFGAGKVIAPNAYDETVEKKNDGDAVYDFITTAAANTKVNASKEAQVSALNSAAAMSELAGVEHSTYAVSSLLTDAVSEHLSLASDKQHDSDIWAKYIHTKENIDGLAIANFGAAYDAQYNGIVVGADLYKSGKAAIGAALTYADGNINGHSLAARTKNEATYYGASIYGGIQNEDSAIIGDISYLHGKHDITQYNSGYSLTADAKTDAFSIGVRAEKSLKAGVGKFVPYAGLRYMHLGTGNYTNSIGMSYDGDDANLWLLPVGVKYSAEVKTGGWTLRPVAELGYVWSMGDREATQTVSLNGASDGFGYDVTDSGSYIGRFGIEAEKANITYGLGYEYQKGDSVKANRWTANLNWSF